MPTPARSGPHLAIVLGLHRRRGAARADRNHPVDGLPIGSLVGVAARRGAGARIGDVLLRVAFFVVALRDAEHLELILAPAADEVEPEAAAAARAATSVYGPTRATG